MTYAKFQKLYDSSIYFVIHKRKEHVHKKKAGSI